MKYLQYFLFFMSAFQAAGQSGHSTRFEKLKNPDSLQLGLTAIVVTGDSVSTIRDTCTIEYDPINQYPYYSFRENTSFDGDTVFLGVNLKRLPVKGNLLLYWLDSEDNPRFLASLTSDEGTLSNKYNWRLPLLKGSTSYLVAILSTRPFTDPENLIAALEFTHGSFIFRQREVLGSGQIPALPQWRLLQNNSTGVEWEPSLLQSEQFAWLPVVFTIRKPPTNPILSLPPPDFTFAPAP